MNILNCPFYVCCTKRISSISIGSTCIVIYNVLNFTIIKHANRLHYRYKRITFSGINILNFACSTAYHRWFSINNSYIETTFRCVIRSICYFKSFSGYTYRKL